MSTLSLNNFKNRIEPNWREVLRGIISRAQQLGSTAVLAFDLDSTLFDNRPRQARILREYGLARGIDGLTACQPEHWTSGWDMKAAMANCGMSKEQIYAAYDDAKQFWKERFFTSAYCVDDIAIPGAVSFIKAVVEASATIGYVTGRHEEMRHGTVEAMHKCGFVTPGGYVQLIMKPNLEMDDDAFKREAHAKLDTLGTLIAAFDNEPAHANDYRQRFPNAIVIHLATDHSGRSVDLLDGIITVPHLDLGFSEP